MKHRARGVKQAAAVPAALEQTTRTRQARWLGVGACWALCFGLLPGPAGSARAEETTDPAAAGRPGAPAAKAAVKAEEPRLKAAKVDKVKRPGAEPASAPVSDADATLVSELRGSSEATAVAAAQKLGAAESPHAAEALLDALALGVPPKVAGAALDALVASKDHMPAARKSQLMADSLQVLTLYARHRSPELRKRATADLAALVVPSAESAPATPGKAGAKSPAKVGAGAPAATVSLPASEVAQVVPILVAALSDSSAEVRAVAAQALGARREKSAEPALIKLLLRKDAAAPAALGQIGGADTARALSEMIGNVPDSFITETLGLLLLRPDFGPDPLRLDVIKTLGKLPGSQPTDILSDYMSQTGKDKADKARPSRAEASKIIEQRTAK